MNKARLQKYMKIHINSFTNKCLGLFHILCRASLEQIKSISLLGFEVPSSFHIEDVLYMNQIFRRQQFENAKINIRHCAYQIPGPKDLVTPSNKPPTRKSGLNRVLTVLQMNHAQFCFCIVIIHVSSATFAFPENW